MAFDDLGDAGGDVDDAGQLPGIRLDADEGGQRQAEGGGIDVEAIAADDAALVAALTWMLSERPMR